MDDEPGDRANDCHGSMIPISVRLHEGEYDNLHRCEKCKQEKYNRVTKDDNFDIIVKLSAESL